MSRTLVHKTTYDTQGEQVLLCTGSRAEGFKIAGEAKNPTCPGCIRARIERQKRLKFYGRRFGRQSAS